MNGVERISRILQGISGNNISDRLVAAIIRAIHSR